MDQFVNISVPVPRDVLLSLRVEGDEFAVQMRALAALKLCESHKLSVGQAAMFAGVTEEEFIKFMGQHGVSIFGSIADITEDYANA
jgi:hypothetical protein